MGKNKGIDAQKLDYSGFRRNFALNPQGIYKLCHRRQRDNFIYNHVGSNHTEKSIERFQATPQGNVEKTSRLEVRNLEKVELKFMEYNMDKASNYWNIYNDIIPQRKRLVLLNN